MSKARTPPQLAPITQPARPGRDAFMRRADAMRRQAAENGDQRYGAVIVKAGVIVGEAPSRVITAGDPTAHAEMEAIRDASRRLETADLSGCIMYSTSPPCAMCETAAHWANVTGLVHGGDMAPLTPRYHRC